MDKSDKSTTKFNRIYKTTSGISSTIVINLLLVMKYVLC